MNIPSLVHSYSAVGYLLICKTNPTSGLTNLIEDLNENCSFDYKYEVWNGEHYIDKLLQHPNILKQFFPKHNKELLELKDNKKE